MLLYVVITRKNAERIREKGFSNCGPYYVMGEGCIERTPARPLPIDRGIKSKITRGQRWELIGSRLPWKSPTMPCGDAN